MNKMQRMQADLDAANERVAYLEKKIQELLANGCKTVQAVALDSAAIVKAMCQVECGAQRGALVGCRDLRKEFPTVCKLAFDSAVMSAAREGKLSLHRHDYVSSLTTVERDELVTDGSEFYVGAAIRRN